MSIWGGASPVGPLNGVRVIDLGHYISAPLTTMLLADQGADVIRIDPPSGVRWNHPANSFLHRGKRRLSLDLTSPIDRRRVQTLIATADVVVENFRPGVADRLGVGPAEQLRRSPRLIYCSLPGFGHDDPRAATPGWEGAVMAAAGAYSVELTGALAGVGAITDPVEFSPLPLGSVFAALESAVAIVAALIARERDGVGQLVEVPMFDALFEASGVRAMSMQGNALALTDFGNGFYRCSDGRWVTFLAMWFRHLEWFVASAGQQQWITDGVVDFDRLWADPEVGNELRRRLIALFATKPAAEWETIGRAHGCTIAMLRSTDEWLSEPHAVESQTVVDVDDPIFGRVRVPGRAVELSGFAPAAPGARRPDGCDTAEIVAALDALRESPPAAPIEPPPARPALDGIRVLDLSRVVAAPTAAKLLAQYGAQVIKIDTDPAHGRASFREPALHEHLNRGKWTMIADLKVASDRALLPDLLSACDVMVHNFGRLAGEHLGIDEQSVRGHAPDIVYVHLNAFGQTGPWSDFRGYAELANISTGITERGLGDRTRVSGSSPLLDNPRWFFTDYAAGVLGAFAAMLGLLHRARTGHGARAETSLIRAAMLEQAPYLIGGARTPALEPRGGTMGWSPLQRLYSTTDGHVFLAATASQTDAALLALDAPPDSTAARLGSSLEHAISVLSSDECCARLRSIGVGVHPVTKLIDLMAPAGIAQQRGLRIEDRTGDGGIIVMPGPVVRLSRTPMQPGTIPRPFGCDRDAIVELVGGQHDE
ncbi:MAG: CoA transferase [Acidimicrobiales bacterium]